MALFDFVERTRRHDVTSRLLPPGHSLAASQKISTELYIQGILEPRLRHPLPLEVHKGQPYDHNPLCTVQIYHAHDMRTIGSVLWPKFRVLQIYGANTGVGKTIFSSILCRAFRKKLENVKYLKPISTGPLEEADDQ